ncbi:Pentatricopeptide repeat-containing protein [Striga hermonthica]|uniref:Pentatricopeptide repeat-containing protein n=1 Tax=Striga hermonthica TaxID=68872 RepID=A0A9N7R0C7_STRHE|nr:Pentatricopeptide repeat-containing protein [Striga hermonthica]
MSLAITSQQRASQFFTLPVKNLNFLKHYNTSIETESFFINLLEKSTHRTHLAQIQTQLFTRGLQNNGFIITKFIHAASKLGQIDYARKLFDEFPHRHVFLWNAIIKCYSTHGMPAAVLGMYSGMQWAHVSPDKFTFPPVLKACAGLRALRYGCSVHGQILRHGLTEDVVSQNGLLSFYVRCGENGRARVVFDTLSDNKRNVVSWTSVISGLVQNGQPVEALRIFGGMMESNVKPDTISLVSVLKACSDIDGLSQGKCIHGFAVKTGFEPEPDLQIALTSLYAKCGHVEDAKSLFDRVKGKNVILWNSMISGFAKNGRAEDALELFSEMLSGDVRPDKGTVQSSVLAVAQLGSLERAKWMDDYVSHSKFNNDVYICSGLIDIHSGLVDEGWNFFLSMKDYGLEPNQKHYACVVDLLGRAGYLEKAHDFIASMPVEPGVSVWGALLSACRVHRDVSLAEYAAGKLFSLDPLNTGHYVQLSNLYASNRMWCGVKRVRLLMKSKGLSKDSGHSAVEINGKFEVFRMGDKSHPRSVEIYKKLEWLEMRLLENGFVPDKESGLHDLDGEDREAILCSHSERLAIAYGLICTSPGTTLRINKNLRACVNCHLATKLITKLVGREIVVRDANRFHHFKEGSCSCGDYW